MILDRVNSIDTKLDRMNGRVDGIDIRLTKIETLQNQNEKAHNQKFTARLVFLTAGLGALWWGVAEVIKRYMLN
ncbi:MAG: hypothetical protein H8D67_23020 [Deltaproteobacteria bacterium]|nr:hypothetical protein [Deltaproteobacteria bacterium]